MKRTTRILAACAIFGLLPLSAVAETYPTKPIRLIVPFPPGGAPDAFSRAIGNQMSRDLKWTVVIENKPGAGGNLGIEAAAKAAPDGYTLVFGQTSNLAINPSLYKKLPYDPGKDLAPIGLIASAPLALVVADNSPYRNLGEVLAAARAKPGTVTFGTPGNGTVAHLAMELLQKQAGVKLQHIPYKGASQALTDVLSGQVAIYIGSVPTVMGQIKNGKLRGLAVTSTHRSAQLPSTPTVTEAGVKQFEADTWFGLLAPAGTPAPILEKLNAELNRALKTPDVKNKIEAEGGRVLGGSSTEFASLMQKDLARWRVVVKDSGATID
ncbi:MULTISPECIES: tripartite tricarboxylate transporter substrate binding protein [unclassified Cupriavidus]|uniref:Bug family tripartite tricarboxylate transporter substrate binding protein n=1 Tax=Cupriavidus sp. L7L TaxID=2546443 RepID=UPI001056CA63|nr:tripartite tricarboxylate transporter substrate binding protein [Cupriavidus sp. IK-TO18]TDF65059.1 tripartite tricarboxylate transporter substrate binding protein [Cupriavidus sp. L7L]